MIAFLLGFVLAAPSAPSPSSIAPRGTDDDSIVATFRCVPTDVEVGEPFELVLELEHPVGASVFELGADELVLDDSWVVFDERRFPPVPVAEDDRRITRRVWTLASLEPGPRTLADSLTPLVFDARIEKVNAAATTVEVRSVLAEGEDMPRPPRGFPAGFGAGVEAEMSDLRFAALAAAALLWIVFGVLVWRRMRGRRGAPQETVLSPLEHLARLESESTGSAEDVRERHFALTRLVRDAADVHLAVPQAAATVDRSGLTDREWLSRARSSHRLTEPCAAELTQLIETSEAVKYAGVVPTGWALEEAFGCARRTLELVTGTAASAAGNGGAQ